MTEGGTTQHVASKVMGQRRRRCDGGEGGVFLNRTGRRHRGLKWSRNVAESLQFLLDSSCLNEDLRKDFRDSARRFVISGTIVKKTNKKNKERSDPRKEVQILHVQ